MITLLGGHFSSRVAASMLTAADLAELVVESPEAYVDLALALYRDRSRLARIRSHLEASRSTCRLFDMAGFAKTLEDVYFRMWEQYCSGERKPILARSATAG